MIYLFDKLELVGARPLHLANARPFGRLKAPLGLSLFRFAPQTRIGRSNPIIDPMFGSILYHIDFINHCVGKMNGIIFFCFDAIMR